MNTYISKICFLLLITSCSSLDISFLKNINILKTPPQNSSMAAIKTDKIILDINNNQYTYHLRSGFTDNVYFQDNNKIISLHKGKIIKSVGLLNDLEHIYEEEMLSKMLTDGESISYLIKFNNPPTSYLQAESSYSNMIANSRLSKKLKTYTDHKNINIVKEEFYVNKINWRGINYYFINSEGNVIYSEQLLNPLSGKAVTYRYIN
jgi:hypothetical protein